MPYQVDKKKTFPVPDDYQTEALNNAFNIDQFPDLQITPADQRPVLDPISQQHYNVPDRPADYQTPSFDPNAIDYITAKQQYGDGSIAAQLSDYQQRLQEQYQPTRDAWKQHIQGQMTQQPAPMTASYSLDDLRSMSPEERARISSEATGYYINGEFVPADTEGIDGIVNNALASGADFRIAMAAPAQDPGDGGGIPVDGPPPTTQPTPQPTPPPPPPTMQPAPTPKAPTTKTPTKEADPKTDYRAMLEALLGNMPDYHMTEEDMLETAQRDAALQIDPIQAALNRALEENLTALEQQRRMAEAAHAGYQHDVDYAMQQAQKQAIESAIARGGGRAGVLDWHSAQLQAPIVGAMERQAATHAAILAGVADQETLAVNQTQQRIVELEQMRGQFEQERMQQLEELQYAREMDNWQMAWQATMQLEQLDEQIRQFDEQLKFNYHEVAQRTATEQAKIAAKLQINADQLALSYRALEFDELKFVEHLAREDRDFVENVRRYDLDYVIKDFIARTPYELVTKEFELTLERLYDELFGGGGLQ